MNDRKDWAHTTFTRLHGRCMGCGRPFALLDVHEMERRRQTRNWEHTCNYLLLCRLCHSGAFDCMSHAKQLAHKLYWDAEHFDLDVWLRLRDPELRAPLRVSIQEVEQHLPYLRERFG